jgi:hypothetical protein
LKNHEESIRARDEGFQSDEIPRRKIFQSSAAQIRRASAKESRYDQEAKRDVPNLRKVVGELVVLNVKGKNRDRYHHAHGAGNSHRRYGRIQ